MRKNFRSILFWSLDRLKGGKILNHYEDVKWHFMQSDSEECRKAVEQKIQKILKHATGTVPFYKRVEFAEGLEGFPVTNKSLIKENFEKFRSSQFLDEENLIPVITSGSTGTPFKLFHNRDKHERNTADTILFGRKAGFVLGEKLLYFKIWSKNNKKSILAQKMQNVLPVDVLNLSNNAEEVLKKIKGLPAPLHMLGYVSAFEVLLRNLQEQPELKPLPGHITSIITMSEYLDPHIKKEGEDYFGCPVLSRYSNVENGIIAQQTLQEQQYFIVNTGSYYVEVLDIERDEVVPYGEPGRIVITDLFNMAMPMIRYDTGDIGVLEKKSLAGINRLCLSTVEGRQLDQIYNTNGKLVSSYLVYKNMWKYPEIDQYQLIQETSNQYTFKIATSGSFNKEKELKKEFLQYLGKDANFIVKYVNEIPLLNSGKRKKVLNMMKKQK